VTLWITAPADPGLGETLARYDRDPYRIYVWRDGALAFALISAMDRERFAGIAEAVRAVTRNQRQPGPETATALRQDRERTPPCSA